MHDITDTLIDQDPAGLVVVALTKVAPMDWPTTLRGIDDVLGSGKGHSEKAVQIAELVRWAGCYRWVLDPGTGAVVGTLDVESAERDAFTDADRQALERVAASRGQFRLAG
jgi:hypothetical protein